MFNFIVLICYATYFVIVPLYNINNELNDDPYEFMNEETPEEKAERAYIERLIVHLEEQRWTRRQIMCMLQQKRHDSTVIWIKKHTDNNSLTIELKT